MTANVLLRLLLVAAREAALDALAILSPVACSGCGAPDRSLCPACRHALRPRPQPVLDAAIGPPIWAALDYSGVVRAVVPAFKDKGRTDAVVVLARALRSAVAAAVAAAGAAGAPEPEAGPVLLVTIPSTRAAFRKRGYHPTSFALRRAGLRPARPGLRLTRQGSDQAGLSAAEREGNRSGSIAASPALAGRRCLIVDDIVTTGATVREATRAIEAVGGRVIGVAAIAHTALRRPHSRSG
ncbi:ComF family protein [Leifsonia poae]|uniref:ComF family protein n=1 Tax=Leifsonia poae TaxID=110933 RepID=UPI001CBEE2E0|nr:phosphoribosyltransferase family protein [Leifsonia poae]